MSACAFHSCDKCVDGPKNVVCVSKYRHSVYKVLGLTVVKCRLPSDCGVNCGMPAAFVLENGHPRLTLDGYCGEKHKGYVISGAWRHAQLRTLNEELDRLEKREEFLKTQIKLLSDSAKANTAPVYVPKKINRMKAEVWDVNDKIQDRSAALADVMDAVALDLSPDSSPRKSKPL
ncbi:19-kDa cys-rich protein [Japanese soil-borne wheat mosaic virus]|uniref:19-kDa cys-rich protein n=1 Tax=Japanese soil-borne wheat mosaic virus TaxID=2030954 RepID=Q9JGJ8_9VIRU|nr:19-kDa cys-rich protein [Japanese soil-borne wheat mosaic virus]BAA94801.1 19-kDa cys-rich protein [Japanese soil-borne wheat mosaic virus]BAI52857.1 19 kDa cysteine-rich protein [Soil-borne wheat mosaic virus RNA2 vector]BAI52859.1 19 kDa cysteine-rich protein [Soil-borne wheat mosaic virus RNA2 vector]